jgi:hypothetical protein
MFLLKSFWTWSVLTPVSAYAEQTAKTNKIERMHINVLLISLAPLKTVITRIAGGHAAKQ